LLWRTRGGPDILLHVNVLRNFGQSSVTDGARVEVIAQRTERGVQATAVLSIQPPYRGAGPQRRGGGTSGTCAGKVVR